jgi:regulator of nonsense transcripts 2
LSIRKKAALSLDSRYVTMVENAYYLVSPPDSPLEAKKERPPMHQYIRYFFGHSTSGLEPTFSRV